jgi:hypothetical protein
LTRGITPPPIYLTIRYARKLLVVHFVLPAY